MVTKDAYSGDSLLVIALYVVDVLLLMDYLRQRLDGGDEAAACTPRGGYLRWLHYTMPMWGAMCMVASALAGTLTGFFITEYLCSHVASMCLLFGSYAAAQR
jgi:hypothetical protein